MSRNVSYTRMLLGIVLVVLVGMFVVGSRQPSQLSQASIFRPGVLVEHVSPSEWSARHRQWTLSLPVGTNPGQDVTGASCAYGQSGPVFFLPSNFAPCTVPADKALLVSIVGTACSTSEPVPFSGSSEVELRTCAALEVDRYTNIEVRIDGELVPDIQSHRVSSPLFSVILPANNVLGAPAGVSYAVADGFQIILKPLPPGMHEIVVHSELADGTVLPDKLALITVSEPVWDMPQATAVIATPVTTDDEP